MFVFSSGFLFFLFFLTLSWDAPLFPFHVSKSVERYLHSRVLIYNNNVHFLENDHLSDDHDYMGLC